MDVLLLLLLLLLLPLPLSLWLVHRSAALETYMRRVYRAHEILDISVDTSGAEMAVDWSFRYRDTAPADTPVSWFGGSTEFSTCVHTRIDKQRWHCRDSTMHRVQHAQCFFFFFCESLRRSRAQVFFCSSELAPSNEQCTIFCLKLPRLRGEGDGSFT